MKVNLKPIAHISSDFSSKFGIPRQSGLADTRARVIFEPDYQNPDALRGLEEYSHIWLLWEFSENLRDEWRPTVRPPRLGGNKRVGVFATRSPFRPNPIGLSCVELKGIELDGPEGPILLVEGADLMDRTPIYDIKPYLPYVDCRPEAKGGFSDRVRDYGLEVVIPDKWLQKIPQAHRKPIRQILEQDPRPSYQKDPVRIYGMEYAGMEIRFTVEDGILLVCEVQRGKWEGER